MGPPGSGKGTQATHVATRFGIPAISTGDIFRANVADQTHLGRIAHEYMDAGEYVPDSVTNSMVRDRLALSDCANGFVLDGYPRTLQQVDELDAVLAEAGATLGAVCELHVDPFVLVDRLLSRARKERRTDDTVEVISRRQDLYAHETEPLIARYAERGLLHRVDGDRHVDLVTSHLCGVLHDALADRVVT
jgi:adenylate kinase